MTGIERGVGERVIEGVFDQACADGIEGDVLRLAAPVPVAANDVIVELLPPMRRPTEAIQSNARAEPKPKESG